MKKSVLTLSLALAVMFGMMVGAKASDVVETITATLDSSIKVVYNGETQEMKDANGNTVYPISYDGTTYLPVRAISNLLGLEVNWDGPTRTVWLGEGFVPTPAEVPTSDPAPASTSSSGGTGSAGDGKAYATKWATVSPNDYPAGTEFTVNGKTYISAGWTQGNFVACQPDHTGNGELVNPLTGTTSVYVGTPAGLAQYDDGSTEGYGYASENADPSELHMLNRD